MEVLNIFTTVFLIIYIGIFLSFYLMMHFVEANGLYTIAKRRGIPHPAYAYIPVFKRYTVAKLAEQFENAQYGKTRSHTKRILIFGIPADILSTALIVGLFIWMARVMNSTFEGNTAAVTSYWILYAVSFIVSAFTYPAQIFSSMAYYKIFRSLDPDTSTLFTILHVLLSVTTPFVILKKKDMDEGFIELQRRFCGQQNDPQEQR